MMFIIASFCFSSINAALFVVRNRFYALRINQRIVQFGTLPRIFPSLFNQTSEDFLP